MINAHTLHWQHRTWNSLICYLSSDNRQNLVSLVQSKISLLYLDIVLPLGTLKCIFSPQTGTSGLFQTLKCALPLHFQTLSEEPRPFANVQYLGSCHFPQQIAGHTGLPIPISGCHHYHSCSEGESLVKGGRRPFSTSVLSALHLFFCWAHFSLTLLFHHLLHKILLSISYCLHVSHIKEWLWICQSYQTAKT